MASQNINKKLKYGLVGCTLFLLIFSCNRKEILFHSGMYLLPLNDGVGKYIYYLTERKSGEYTLISNTTLIGVSSDLRSHQYYFNSSDFYSFLETDNNQIVIFSGLGTPKLNFYTDEFKFIKSIPINFNNGMNYRNLLKEKVDNGYWLQGFDCLQKLDSNYSFLWAKKYDSRGFINKSIELPDGSLLLFGYETSFKSKAMLQQVDKSGNLVKSLFYNKKDTSAYRDLSAVKCVIEDQTGFTLAAGIYDQSKPVFFGVNKYNIRSWLIKCNWAGDTIFTKEIPGGEPEQIFKTKEGYLMHMSAKENNSERAHSLVLKLNNQFDVLESHRYGGDVSTVLSYSSAMTALKDGNFLLAISTNTFNSPGQKSNILFLKLNANGGLVVQ